MRNLLAIEAAVLGGSISLLDEAGSIIASKAGESDVSRAEDLLLKIDDLLRGSGTSLAEVGKIAVSNGPGSYTGVRIGIATALGLKNALNIDCVGLSVIHAMAASWEAPRVTAAVPIGKRDVVWQTFATDLGPRAVLDSPRAALYRDFLGYIEENSNTVILVPSFLFTRVSADRPEKERTDRLVDAGLFLSEYIGRAALASTINRSPEPIYARSLGGV